MHSKDLILAIDNGIQSLKALIFDPQGQLLAKEAVTFDSYFSEQPAWARRSMELWGSACTQTLQQRSRP